LCDLKLGPESGLDFLRWLRAREKLRIIPLTILTGSPFPGWVNSAYAAGASCVISKPMAYQDLSKLVSQLAAFWCELAELPSFK
jgi:CheY-like chemotaxis protein